MSRTKQREKIIIGLGVLLLIIALMYQHFANKKDVLNTLKQGEPAAASYENLSVDYPSYKVWDAQGHLLGYAAIGNASGYGGELNALTIVEENGEIKSVSLLQNYETPLYLNKVLKTGILDAIAQKNIRDNIADVDAVSGATISRKAIINAVQKSTVQIGNRQLGLAIPVSNEINLGWKDLAVIALILLAIVCSARNYRKLRPWVLVLSVLIAFLYNYSLTYCNYLNFVTGKLPTFTERPIWYILVPGILIMTLLWRRNFYCSWLCPFGAVQEGIFRSLNLFEFAPSERIKNKVTKFRWPMLWLAAMLALMTNNPGITGYEPFSVFFDGNGNTAQWVIMLSVLVICIAQMRFWCNSFCPVGLILNFTAQLRRTFLRKKDTELYKRETLACSECNCPDCDERGEPLNKQDKLFIFLAIVLNVLILIALLENIMLDHM